MQTFYVMFPDGTVQTYEASAMNEVSRQLFAKGILKFAIYDEKTYQEEVNKNKQ